MVITINEKKYKKFVIQQISPFRGFFYAISFLISAFCILFYGIENVPFSSSSWTAAILFFMLMIAAVIFPMYFGFKLATAIVEITLDDDGLQRKWLKKFFLSSADNIFIPWNKIIGYLQQPDYNYEKFKIIIRNKPAINIYHLYQSNPFQRFLYGRNDDDFYLFIAEFKYMVERKNAEFDSSGEYIKQEKTVYETTWALVLAIFLVLLTVTTIIITLIFNPTNPIPYGISILAASGSAYFVSNVINFRRKSKKT